MAGDAPLLMHRVKNSSEYFVLPAITIQCVIPYGRWRSVALRRALPSRATPF